MTHLTSWERMTLRSAPMMDALSYANCNGQAIDEFVGSSDRSIQASGPALETAGEGKDDLMTITDCTDAGNEVHTLSIDHGWNGQLPGHVQIHNGHKVRIFNGPLPHPPELAS